jgi:hypothetical protein
MKRFFFMLCFISISIFSQAQNSLFLLPGKIVGRDTFAEIDLAPVYIVSINSNNQMAVYKFNLLKYNIGVVWPYAVKAATIYKEINDEMASSDSKRQQKKFIKAKQKELEQQFSSQLKNLTTTQGLLLVKLISRETNQNVYDLIKTYKSGVTAFYWQSIGHFLGYDLKVNYDPQEDKEIEYICESYDSSVN